MKGKPLETDGRFFIRTVLSLALITLSVIALVHGSSPTLPKQNFSVIEGSLSNQEVTFEKVRACKCDAGLHDQSYKKFKFKLTNNSQEILNIAGGRDSSVFLIVEYPNTFHPKVTLPGPANASDERALGSLPAGVEVSYASSTEVFEPLRFAPTLATQLGVRPEWTAYAIPPTPNAVIEAESGSTTLATFPTYVTRLALASGDSYSDKRAGYGDWVFPIPVWGVLRTVSNEPNYTTVFEPNFYDKYYAILGIAAISADGRLLGFTASPPTSTLSDGSEF